MVKLHLITISPVIWILIVTHWQRIILYWQVWHVGMVYYIKCIDTRLKTNTFKWAPLGSYKLNQSVYSFNTELRRRQWTLAYVIWGKYWSKAVLIKHPEPANILQLAVLTIIHFVKSALIPCRYESSWTLDWASQQECTPFCRSFFHSSNKLSPACWGFQVENLSCWMVS